MRGVSIVNGAAVRTLKAVASCGDLLERSASGLAGSSAMRLRLNLGEELVPRTNMRGV
jgi:hypothetical protein